RRRAGSRARGRRGARCRAAAQALGPRQEQLVGGVVHARAAPAVDQAIRPPVPAAVVLGEPVDEFGERGLADLGSKRADRLPAAPGHRVAGPRADDDVGTVGHHPGVLVHAGLAAAGGARLGRHLPVPAQAPLLLVVLEDVGDEVALGLAQDPYLAVLPAGPLLVDRVPGGV